MEIWQSRGVITHERYWTQKGIRLCTIAASLITIGASLWSLIPSSQSNAKTLNADKQKNEIQAEQSSEISSGGLESIIVVDEPTISDIQNSENYGISGGEPDNNDGPYQNNIPYLSENTKKVMSYLAMDEVHADPAFKSEADLREGFQMVYSSLIIRLNSGVFPFNTDRDRTIEEIIVEGNVDNNTGISAFAYSPIVSPEYKVVRDNNGKIIEIDYIPKENNNLTEKQKKDLELYEEKRKIALEVLEDMIDGKLRVLDIDHYFATYAMSVTDANEYYDWVKTWEPDTDPFLLLEEGSKRPNWYDPDKCKIKIGSHVACRLYGDRITATIPNTILP